MGLSYKGGERRKRGRWREGRKEYTNKRDRCREREDRNIGKEFPELNEGRWSVASTKGDRKDWSR